MPMAQLFYILERWVLSDIVANYTESCRSTVVLDNSSKGTLGIICKQISLV